MERIAVGGKVQKMCFQGDYQVVPWYFQSLAYYHRNKKGLQLLIGLQQQAGACPRLVISTFGVLLHNQFVGCNRHSKNTKDKAFLLFVLKLCIYIFRGVYLLPYMPPTIEGLVSSHPSAKTCYK